MTSSPVDVATLLEIVATEPATLDALNGCVQRLRHVEAAKRELARMPPSMVLSGFVDRRVGGGDLS